MFECHLVDTAILNRGLYMNFPQNKCVSFQAKFLCGETLKTFAYTLNRVPNTLFLKNLLNYSLY